MNCTFCHNEDLISLPEIASNLALWECRQCCVTYVLYVQHTFSKHLPVGYELMGYTIRPDDFNYELHQSIYGLDEYKRTSVVDHEGNLILSMALLDNINPDNAKDWIIRLLNLKVFL